MNILYIAYSCDPYKGSEDKIGWNIPFENAKQNTVFVITKEEHRQAILEYCREHKIENIQFYFVDIPEKYKKIFQSFLYSGRLNIWHKKAMYVAKEVCAKENIDIIHQITPIEFRSIGDYGKIPNVKFVCGPLGGGEFIPHGLRTYAKGHAKVEFIRKGMNAWSRFLCKFKKMDYVMYANCETKDYLTGYMRSCQNEVYSEIGLSHKELVKKECSVVSSAETGSNQGEQLSIVEECVFLVAGRLVYRKGHDFLLDALLRMPKELKYKCHIVGDGPEMENLIKKVKVYSLNDKVVFTGKIPYSEMEAVYRNSDVFVMPSIRETTGTVLLEAMANGLPVVTIDKFGGGFLLDEDTGWLFKGNTKDEYVDNLRNVLMECITQPDEVAQRGKNARTQAERYTWEEKIVHYNSIYDRILN